MSSVKSILVTGGSGFIGSHLMAELQEDHRVRNFDCQEPEHQVGKERWIHGDIRDQTQVARAVEGMDVVLHQAGLVNVERSIADPTRCHAINLQGTLHILEAARRHDVRVVVASSAAVYGDPQRVPISESHPLIPRSPYGIDKAAADLYARRYAQLYDLPTVALRYFNVYGPGQTGGDYAGVIQTFLRQATAGQPLTVNGDGTQTRDFIHVSDVVRANRRAMETNAIGRAFNIGTGRKVSINQLAGLINDRTPSESEIVHHDPRAGDIDESVADPAKAREVLGFEAEIDIEEGLDRLTSQSPIIH